MISVAIVAQTNSARTHIAQCLLSHYWSRISACLSESPSKKLPTLYITSCGVHHTKPVHEYTIKLLTDLNLLSGYSAFRGKQCRIADSVFQAHVLGTSSNRSLFNLTRKIDCVVNIDDPKERGHDAGEPSDGSDGVITAESPSMPSHWKGVCPKLQYCTQWITISPDARPQRKAESTDDNIYTYTSARRSGRLNLPVGIPMIQKLQNRINQEPEPIRRRVFQDDYQGEPMYLQYIPMAIHSKLQGLNSPGTQVNELANTNFSLDKTYAYDRVPFRPDEENNSHKSSMLNREKRLYQTKAGRMEKKYGVDEETRHASVRGSKVLRERRVEKVKVPKMKAEDLPPLECSAPSMPSADNIYTINRIFPVSDRHPAEDPDDHFGRFIVARDALAVEMQKIVLRLLVQLGVIHGKFLEWIQEKTVVSQASTEEKALFGLFADAFSCSQLSTPSPAAPTPSTPQVTINSADYPVPNILKDPTSLDGEGNPGLETVQYGQTTIEDISRTDLLSDDGLL
ncbi:hypothetical protein XU18_3520 [Perkinsela sp. CCAP 1560/4]|nr:hypothetical protein XU18_3520 [Perkinsela sp. CCAP 1560/4]|eukprot:KNH05549.1 hypothetical protein XU18_3520 [Perkinsela sp. CCAP 1560/4]